MGDTGRILTVRLRTIVAEELDEVVTRERRTARPGHTVTRNGIIALAVEQFVAQRLRRQRSTGNNTRSTDALQERTRNI